MTLPEKVAYLKGLAEGLDLGDSKEDKLIKSIIEVLEEVSDNMTDIEDDIIDMGEQIDEIDEDLAALEDEYYGDDEDEEDFEDDDEYYEVTCPNCNDTIYLDEDSIIEGCVECPNCGSKLPLGCDCENCDGCDE